MQPAISVLLPVYRPNLEYLRAAIESILQQTFTSFELIIIEAESEVSAKTCLLQFGDSRIFHVTFQGQASLVDQLNRGLQQARAPLIARMDGDDWSYPERLQQQFDYLQRHPEVTVLGTAIHIMDGQGNTAGKRVYPTDSATIHKSLRRFNALAHPSVMYRKKAVLDAGGYWYRDYPANEDYELWCRLASKGHQLANLEEPLLRYRIHAGAMKSEKLKGILRGTRLVKRHYFRDTMSWADKARYWAEGLLLNLPGPVIYQLFTRTHYQKGL